MLRGSKGGHSCRGQVRVPGSLSLEDGTPKFSPQALLGDPVSLIPVLAALPCTIRQFLSCSLEYLTLGLDGCRDSSVASSTKGCGCRWFQLLAAQRPAGGLPAPRQSQPTTCSADSCPSTSIRMSTASQVWRVDYSPWAGSGPPIFQMKV